MKLYIDKSELEKIKLVSAGKEELSTLCVWRDIGYSQGVELTIKYKIINKMSFFKRLKMAINQARYSFTQAMKN